METSWSELMLIGIVALIVIGPKDLPAMFRELGRISAKLRSMGREFSRAMETAAKESGVKDVAADLRKVASPASAGLDAVRSAADKFEKWDPLKPNATPKAPLTPPAMPPMVPATPAAAASPAAGPATAALAEKVAAKKTASAGKVAALREAKAAPVAAPIAEAPAAEPPAAKRGGRVRKKPDAGDQA